MEGCWPCRVKVIVVILGCYAVTTDNITNVLVGVLESLRVDLVRFYL